MIEDNGSIGAVADADVSQVEMTLCTSSKYAIADSVLPSVGCVG